MLPRDIEDALIASLRTGGAMPETRAAFHRLGQNLRLNLCLWLLGRIVKLAPIDHPSGVAFVCGADETLRFLAAAEGKTA
jgi:hypothetical protein